eukprot:TRINITY_DN45857_c0_g1_i1.p2 TRINITY_DN45857_c0_g1~~TRINITY_DN45857_c0_g1_i1.p2  ORF type:complete len:270 (+),score=85.01 TRINITY_DN45857_c0_g1_i1:59-868(+)
MGWGKKKGAQTEPEDDLLWNATSELAKELAVTDPEVNVEKLEKKLRDYFRKATKELEFGKKPWQQLINDCADAAFATLFNALSDKTWLPTTDFVLCLDATIKDSFPSEVLGNVSQYAFERTVLAAHDRAMDEQRASPILWETTKSCVPGQAARKKMYNACEFGRKHAAIPNKEAENEVEDYVGRWIDAACEYLAKANGGDPEWTLPAEETIKVFQELVSSGGLPVAMVETHGPPPEDWPFIEEAVRASYAHQAEAHKNMGGNAKRRRKN